MDPPNMPFHTDVRDFVVGIDYDSVEENKGHFTIRRKVTMTELIEELQGFVTVGHNFPQFPPEANPSVMYAWDLSDLDDGDCYGEVVNELSKIKKREIIK